MRCPVCKADNNETPQCRRCKADLSLLVALERRRERALENACNRLANGDSAGALAAARMAHGLKRDETSRRVLALARLFTGDHAGAWAAFQALTRESPAGATVSEPDA
jgi:hypothetical protein